MWRSFGCGEGLSAAHIAQEMQRNLDFLSTTTRNVEERHRSMRAVFDRSWTFLSEAVLYGCRNDQSTNRPQLIIGAGTVKTHTLTIYRKLEVANGTQAILCAQELGLLRA